MSPSPQRATALPLASTFAIGAPNFRQLLVYILMIAGSIGAFLLIRSLGGTLPAPAGEAFRRSGTAGGDVLAHVLLALVVIIALAQLLGMLFRRFHQPAVIGEMVAGILLGPSALGWVFPEAANYLMPKEIAPLLGMLAQVGVILFMFLVGLELNTGLLRQKTHASVAISHASIMCPFLLGAAAALWLYPQYGVRGTSFTVFALFFGVSLSVTAFPVLARILTDRGMSNSKLGTIALTCAAVDDVSAWCLLALLVSVAQAEPGRVLITVTLTVVFAVAVILARPLALRFVRYQERKESLTRGAMAAVLVALLLCALTTESIGIHALFGAFLLGVIIPHKSTLALRLREKLEDVVVVLFLPAFFAFTGMRTQIGLVKGLEGWLICIFIILLASAGKFGGSFLAAKLSGLNTTASMGIGVLMNTRGLMELVVLNLGLDLGVLSPPLFTMLVLMALVTTFATTPMLHWIGADVASKTE